MIVPLVTPRLRFRSWRASDLGLALGLWGDPRVTEKIDARTPLSRAQVEDLLARQIACEREHRVQYWPVFRADSGEHVGCCGLGPRDVAAGVYEFGVQIRADHWGRGYAAEAARSVMAHAFALLGASFLFAGHHPDNAASRRLLAKLAFRYTHDEYYEPTGRMHPSYLRAGPARLRLARPDEFARFTAFEADPAAAPFVNTDPPEVHARRAARDDVAYLSIEHGRALVGFVLFVLDPDGRSVELRRIVVARPDLGIGQKALMTAIGWCKRTWPDRTRLWLDVAPFNARAKHVYEKLGFTYFAGTPSPGADEALEFLERPLPPR